MFYVTETPDAFSQLTCTTGENPSMNLRRSNSAPCTLSSKVGCGASGGSRAGRGMVELGVDGAMGCS